MDFNTLIRTDFIVIALFLNAIGAILKYRTPLDNKLIPSVLFAISFVVCNVGLVHERLCRRCEMGRQPAHRWSLCMAWW